MVKNRVKQILLALEQLLNACTPGGYCDECISARAWRERMNNKWWSCLRTTIDSVALMVFHQQDHCYQSWISEFEKHQLPPAYRDADRS